MAGRLLLVAISAWSLAASAEVNKWVDKQGKVYYGDPPQNKEVKERRAERGTVSTADGKYYSAAPEKWKQKAFGAPGASGGGSPGSTPIERAKNAGRSY